VRKLRQVLKEHPDAFVLQVDLSNAFNTVDRAAAISALSKDAPELSAWCRFNYGIPAHLHCGDRLLASTQGTQQGDPMGPAMFASAIQPLLDELPGSFRLLWQAWYLDDGLLVGEEAELRRVLDFLSDRFAALGLKVNLSKCRIWSPQGSCSPACPVPSPSCLVHVTAFLSSSLCEVAGYFSPTGEEAPPDAALWESLERFQVHVGTSAGIWTQWSRDRVLPPADALENGGWLKQKTWTDILHTTVSTGLLDCVGRRDQVRLLREREPHAGAWLTCVPNASLGLTFGAAEYRLLLRQHLGLPVLDESAVGSACPECGEALDLFGDHLVSCRHAGA
jgi:hypothetical protein